MGSLCLQPLFLRIIYIIGRIINIIKFVVPIVLIIRVAIDMYRHVINPEDKDGLSKIKNKIIASIVIFLTPTIISLLYSFIEKTIVNYEYSDLTVCREFANMDYIVELENKIKELEKEDADKKRESYLNNYEQMVEEIRLIVANKNNDNSDTNDASNSGANSNDDLNDDNTQSVITNASGSLNSGKYNGWKYYLYIPNGAKTTNKPLVVFLHGSGERGTDISKLENYGFAKYINKNKKDYDTYILMPQLPSGSESWDTSKLMTLINKIVSENRVDRSRISISGFSLGTATIPNLIKENQSYFSAVVFIATCTDGGNNASYFRNIPTRLYHGGNDSTKCKPSLSESFANKIKKENGNVNVKILPNRPHNIVDDVFKDGKVISWMTSQRR